MRNKRYAPIFGGALLVAASAIGCGGSTPPPNTVPEAAAPEAAAAGQAAATDTAAAEKAAVEPAVPVAPQPVLTVKDGLSTPESALYLADEDVYLVSNINGGPNETDNNGFISKIAPDGAVVALRWIEGGKNGVKLDAPKGMAAFGGKLYVADISRVRMFDLKTGKPKGEVKLPGATFINDLAAAADGTIYASDTGIKIAPSGITPTKTDAIWAIKKGAPKKIAKGADLAGPNGVLPADKGVWVVSFGSGELYRVDEKGARQDVQKLPKGQLDGLVAIPDGLLISSWEGQTVFKGKAGGEFTPWLKDIAAPADIGVDTKRNRVLVPRFSDNKLEIYEIK